MVEDSVSVDQGKWGSGVRSINWKVGQTGSDEHDDAVEEGVQPPVLVPQLLRQGLLL